VHVAGPQGGTCLDEAAVITAYGTVFDQLRTFALTPSRSRQRLMPRCTRLRPAYEGTGM
jgi:hypothetical protein